MDALENIENRKLEKIIKNKGRCITSHKQYNLVGRRIKDYKNFIDSIITHLNQENYETAIELIESSNSQFKNDSLIQGAIQSKMFNYVAETYQSKTGKNLRDNEELIIKSRNYQHITGCDEPEFVCDSMICRISNDDCAKNKDNYMSKVLINLLKSINTNE